MKNGYHLYLLYGLFYLCLYIDVLSFDYNWTVLLIELILLYIELKDVNEPLKFNLKKNLYFGLFCGTTILLKQTSGLIFTICFIFYKIIYVNDKKTMIEYIKYIVTRLIGAIIPVIILVIYLYINGIFEEFIDYTILRYRYFF